MEMQRVKLKFNAIAVSEALDAALGAGLLCDVCTTKVQTKAIMSQSDFCRTCQGVIQMQLRVIVERRLRVVLIENGMSPDDVKVMSEG